MLFETTRASRYGVYWHCRCDCGSELDVVSSSLRRNTTKSCGCLNRELTTARNIANSNENPWEVEYIGFQAHALEREIPVSIDVDQFRILSLGRCYYCNSAPSQICKAALLRDTKKNGIDRVDSKIGYDISNCVSCCKFCNLAKSISSFDEFCQMTKSRYEHMKEKGWI